LARAAKLRLAPLEAERINLGAGPQYPQEMNPCVLTFSLAVVGMLGTTACGPGFQKRLPDIVLVPSRLVVMPVISDAYELDFNGTKIPRPEWAEAMAEHANSEVLRIVGRHGGRELPFESVKACGDRCLELIRYFTNWSLNASMQIAAQMGGRTNYKQPSVGSWKAQADFSPLRTAMNSDFVLVVRIRDIWETSGRVIGGILSSTTTTFKQVGVACVANLSDGRMVWCETIVDGWGDLRTAPGAQALIRKLFRPLWPDVYPTTPTEIRQTGRR
jgi:hypothetical protein